MQTIFISKPDSSQQSIRNIENIVAVIAPITIHNRFVYIFTARWRRAAARWTLFFNISNTRRLLMNSTSCTHSKYRITFTKTSIEWLFVQLAKCKRYTCLRFHKLLIKRDWLVSPIHWCGWMCIQIKRIFLFQRCRFFFIYFLCINCLPAMMKPIAMRCSMRWDAVRIYVALCAQPLHLLFSTFIFLSFIIYFSSEWWMWRKRK